MNRVTIMTTKKINELNQRVLKHWMEPKRPKPDVHKLYLEMKDDPQWKDKVWHPMTTESVAKHLNDCRLSIPKSGSSGC